MIRIDRGDETLDQEYSTLWSGHGDGPEPSVVDFLAHHPDASSSERSDVLLADQWLRWRCGCPKTVGDYLAEHPALADDPEAILKLVQGEFRARLDRGETPEPDSYARMFPGLAEEIRLQCEVDRWLTLASPSDTSSMATTLEYPGGDLAGRAHDDATDDAGRPAPAPGGPVDLDAPLPGDDFELVRPLGMGGMGQVYEAIQKSLRKRVALKLIRLEALDSPARVRRFFAEARALARLHHPHIVGVHGIGRMADGRYFLVMDLVEDGTTLAALLRRGTVSFDRAAGLVATVAEAIEHAHGRGVIHRDLKPSNVLLDADGRPHVTDFGLAKVFDAADPDNPQTTADQILGTPHYMAPEQADPARGPITPRIDVYALGGLLYALLTGRPPIQGDSLTAVLTRVISPEPVPAARTLRGDVPAALERICRSCLEKDAEKRPPSAVAVAEALRAWLARPEAGDPAGAEADSRGPTAGSSDDPDGGRSRSGWATDRSLKDGRRTPNPDRWGPKWARPAGSRRTIWAAGAVASTLALLLIAVPLAWMRMVRDEAIFVVPTSSGGIAEAKPAPKAVPVPRSIKAKAAGPLAPAPKADSSGRSIYVTMNPPSMTAIQEQERARISINAYMMPPPDLVARRHAEATIALHQATLERVETKLGPDHPDTLVSRDYLASAYLAAGRAAEAIKLHEETLKLRETKLGPDHPDTLLSLNNLANTLGAEGRYAEAEAMHRRALAIRLKALGEAHPDTAESLNNLAKLLHSRGDYERARILFERALVVRQSALGERHSDTASTYNDLGELLRAQRDYGGARGYFERALAMRRALYPEDRYPHGHPELATSLDNLGALLRAQGDYGGGRSYLERALAMRQALYPKDRYPHGHPELARSLNDLGELLRAQGDYGGARGYYERALAMNEALYPEDRFPQGHSATASSYHILALTLRDQGKAAEAERLLRGLLDRQRAKPPADHPAVAGTLATLGPILLDQQKWAEAELVLRECLAIRQGAQPDEWSTFNTRSQLGVSLLGQGRFAEAEPLILAGYEGMKAREAELHAQGRPRLAEAARRVIELYEAWGKPDKAAAWRTKLGLAELPADVFSP